MLDEREEMVPGAELWHDRGFRAALRPGTYAVRLGLMTEARELGELVMAERDEERDFRLRGAWVDR